MCCCAAAPCWRWRHLGVVTRSHGKSSRGPGSMPVRDLCLQTLKAVPLESLGPVHTLSHNSAQECRILLSARLQCQGSQAVRVHLFFNLFVKIRNPYIFDFRKLSSCRRRIFFKIISQKRHRYFICLRSWTIVGAHMETTECKISRRRCVEIVFGL